MLAIKNRTELDVVRYKESRKKEGIRYNGMLWNMCEKIREE